ncbi:MAG: Smr/MutS family protein [Flavobacterium sp.]|nr:Smr/MutS family protein [Flavobacterium sp.]
MYFNIGKKVAVLDDILKGVIVSLNGQVVGIKDNDGMVYEYNQNELVVIEEDQHQLSKYSDINNPLFNDKLQDQKVKVSSFKKENNEVILEVDLHINQLIKSTKGMDNFEMLSLQLETAKRKIEYAISKRISKIIFIHGVGEGVLKSELHYLFGRYPVRFYDASYKKYGLGATEVYVFQNPKL